MKIKIISPQTAEVVLTQLEADELGLCYSSLNNDSPNFRSAVTKILKEMNMTADLENKYYNLCVEAVLTEEGGVKLSLTLLDSSGDIAFNLKRTFGPVVFKFENQNDLSVGCNKIAESYLHRIYKSSLFSFNSIYYLVVYPLDTVDNRTIGFLLEYGSMVGTGDIIASYIAEHSKLIIPDNAIDIWSELDL